MSTEMKKELPWWQKYTLTLNEASEYFGIGYKKLKLFVQQHPEEDFVLIWFPLITESLITIIFIAKTVLSRYNGVRREAIRSFNQPKHLIPSGVCDSHGL